LEIIVNATTIYGGFGSDTHSFAIRFAYTLPTDGRPPAYAEQQQNKGIRIFRNAFPNRRSPVARTVVFYPLDSSLW
jgi:hypothetical protein